MKLTAILMLATALQVSALGYSQTVTLHKRNIPLTQVFQDIEKQTGYLFLYDDALVDKKPAVSLNLEATPLKEALNQLLKDINLDFRIIQRTIVIQAASPRLQFEETPQQQKLVGRVMDATSQKPVIGASVVVKGTSNGTATDENGSFSIGAQKGDELVISSIGYQSKIVKVGTASNITIWLQTSSEGDSLSNIVVTGYQRINKDSYTGTAVVVSGDDLKRVNPQNMLQSLQAFDPSFKLVDNNLVGSNPNSLPNINVRGSTALPSGTQAISRNNLSSQTNLPTFILDGYEVSLQKVYDLDINRVESVTLLKDAAATAIYGSRAANGVMVITTKAPQEGKLQLSYNYELTVSAPDLSNYNVLDARGKLEYEKLAGLYSTDYNEALSQDQLDMLYYQKKERVESGVNTYWLSQPLRTGLAHKNSLYLEGGSKTFRYGIDLRYQTQPGVMKGSARDRFSGGMNFSYNAGKNLMFKNSMTITQVNSKESPYGGFSQYVKMNPYYPKTDSLGNTLREVETWVNRGGAGNGIINTTVLNPLYDAQLSSFYKTNYLEFIDAFTADWTITRGLRLVGTASLMQRKINTDYFLSPLANAYYFYATSQLDERGQYTYWATNQSQFDGNLRFLYNQKLGDHFFNMVLGTNLQTSLEDAKSFTATGFTNDRFSNIGFANSYPENSTPGSSKNEDRLIGFMYSLNYAYSNKYLLDFSFREDGSSKFGSNKKFAPFWALGLGWNLHKEAFLKNTVFSTLKVRASMGETGSVSFPSYQAITTYGYYTSNWYSTGVGAVVTNYGNENLQWQKTRNYDVGMDIGFLKDRLIISPRYYYKLTRGLLADIVLPPSTGFGSYKENLGDMENEGAELSIDYQVINSRNWKLKIVSNLVHNKNIIRRISNALQAYNDKADEAQVSDDYKGAPLIRYNEGESLNTIYAVRSLGIDPENGRELYVKKDGTLTYDWDVKDITPVGDETATAYGYTTATLSYKNVTLMTVWYSTFGGDLYNQTLVDRVENADPRYNVDARVLAQRWKQPGDVVFYKNIADQNSTQTSSRFVQKNNVLSLNSLYLSYDLPASFYSKLAMHRLRVALTAVDVFRSASVKQERGIDYPFARSFTFSLQAGF